MRLKNSKREVYTVILIMVLLVVPMVSAGFFDWVKKTITGKASSQPTDVSVTVSGVNPVTIQVWNSTLTGTYVQPTEESAKKITFNVTVNDPDGRNDINDSSVKANFSFGSDSRYNSTACVEISGEYNNTSQNYSCTVSMWYWDTNDTWTINVTANDLGNKSYVSDASTSFDYGLLTAIKMSPSTVYWSSVTPGDSNQTASNSTVINNTGNHIIQAGNVEINSTNLHGSSSFIDVGNITVDTDTGGSPPAECDGTALQNKTYTGISNANLTIGNLSQGGGTAQEQLYYCLQVPSTVPSGDYNTSQEGSWTVRVV
ncbi:hypothetical protein GF386_03350 [Candidatus Pacearchaeota archaeon]|nr:hypothetical protein [Candidatus Pacearchaeota archaeon]MBD3283176.1 hypothetical protein [Candidatus Pacearchaeota archaeon]